MRDVSEIIGKLAKLRAEKPLSDDDVKKWEFTNEVVPKLKSVRLDPRFHIQIKKWDCKPQESVYNSCRELIKGNGAIVALVGERGAGKTTIASQFIIDRAMGYFEHPELWPVPYTKLNELVSLFKPIYADFGSIDIEALMRRRDAFCSYSLRVIDEIHDCDDQKMKNRVLVDILDRSYAKKVDSIIISNQTVAEFKNTTDDSILSRITEHGRIIPCNWGSWRSRKAANREIIHPNQKNA